MEPTIFSIDTNNQVVYALGWTVLHSLWQGTLIALLVGVLAAFINKRSSQIRYWTGFAGLLGVLFWAAYTFVRVYSLAALESMYLTTIIVDDQTELVLSALGAEGAGGWLFFMEYFDAHLPMIVTCWLIGMSVFALRFLGGLAYVQQLKYQYHNPVEPSFLILLEQLKAKMQLEKVVTLIESTKIRVPMTIGHIKPVILLPVGALLALSPAQVEAILAHELAHIKRNDFLLNLFQSIVEVLFYYHPAVWWLSAQVRMERENCCDDIAVAACGDDLEYAKALLSLQEYAKASPTFAMAFSHKKNHLLNRVKRILNHPINSNRIMEKFSITALILMCLLVLSMRDGRNVLEPNPNRNNTMIQVEEPVIVEQPDQLFIHEITPSNHLDTIPQGKINLKLTKSGEKIEAKMEKGKITELKVNGEVQPKSEYAAYLPVLEEVLNIPPPPAPPAPGMAPAALPAPPAPPAPGMTPAAPPAPPAVFEIKKSFKVKKDGDKNGNTFLFIKGTEGEEPVEIKISGAQGEQVVFLNGERVVDGEELIIAKEIEFGPGSGTQKIRVNGMNMVFRGDDQHDSRLVWVDSVRSNLAMVWSQESAAERQAELEKMQAELARMRESGVEESNERLKQVQKELEASQKQLQAKERKFVQERELMKEARLHEVEARLQDRKLMLDGELVELERVMEDQNIAVEEVRALAESKRINQKEMLEEMLKDGLLESTEDYNIIISDSSLKVNGKKQPQSVFNKYKKIYEKGNPNISGNYKITMKKSND